MNTSKAKAFFKRALRGIIASGLSYLIAWAVVESHWVDIGFTTQNAAAIAGVVAVLAGVFLGTDKAVRFK